MRLIVAALLTLAACGTDPSSTGDDDSITVDGPPRVPVTTDVQCETHTMTVNFPDGRRLVYEERVALLDGVGPDTDFTLETCGYRTLYSCPAGASCVGDVGALGSDACVREHRSGFFVDGKLRVVCGSTETAYNAAGTITSRSDVNRPVKLTIY